MLNRLKKNDKKGFTLVELIVVLVILAILAALLIPALTGYIDRAKEKQLIAETRQVVMAAQTIADEQYAIGTATATIQTALATGGSSFDDLIKLADVTKTAFTAVANVVIANGHIDSLDFTNSAGKTCKFDRDSTGEVYDPQ